ncbi:ABC transporter substrate-binding protein [Granulosicoccus sp. 3-233]|uniref:ABC transporter substrate-binding protein n=1 Tax=Granulosicoccus sp. 3-233 TaxID=3417969 RepID=UPI003D356074
MTSLGMRHYCGSGLIVILLLSAMPGMLHARSLKVYTLPDYLAPELVSEFEQLHDTTIEFSYFDSDEARDQELAITNGSGHDVLLVNRLQIPKYVRRAWLHPLSTEDIPNMRHIDQRWSDTLGDVSHYAVASLWGILGIGYRQDQIPEGLGSWKELLQPRDALRNRISMPAYTRELIAIAMKKNDLSVNTSDEAMIVEAGRQLLEQKPFVRYYGYPLLDENSDLVTGKVWAGAFYNGDVLSLQRFNNNIRFVFPEEGGIIWSGYLAVAQSSNNKSLAFAFIDFLNEPTVAARQAEFSSLATPNKAARAHLPKAYLEHPDIHPAGDMIERSEFLESLPPRSQKQINIIGTQLIH